MAKNPLDDMIILERYEFSVQAVDKDRFTKTIKQLYTTSKILDLANQTGISQGTLENMTFEALVKADIADKDFLGYKRFRQVLKDAGYNV